MTREYIDITSEEQWLGLRKKDVTSTGMSGILDMSPYCTPFEAYHAYKYGLHLPFEDSERMQKGRRMEAYVAQEVAIRTGWEVEPLNVYARDPELRMGSSFDFQYKRPDGRRGLLEIKGVDYPIWRDKWGKPEDDGEAPPYIEIQAQHQLEVWDKFDETTIVACTSIYDFHLYERQRDREFGQNLREAVKKFWEDVDAGNEPRPNYYRDESVLAALYRDAGGEPIDMLHDEEFDVLLSKYKRLSEEETSAATERRAVKNEIHHRLESAGGAYTHNHKVLTTWVKGVSGTLITPEMVGTYQGGRAGYRQCRITKIK